MATAPRNFVYLTLLGVILLTIAIVVRSGMLARKDNPRDRPINSAMREALNAQKPQLTVDDEMLVNQTYGTAHKLPSGLRYVVRNPGQGDAKPQIGDEVIYGKYGGTDIKVNGQEVKILREGDILAKLVK